MQDIRGLNVSKLVTGFGLQNYVMKQLFAVSSSSSWQERYYQESSADLTATGTGNDLQGIPRLAAFPHGEVKWTQQNSYHQKFGIQGVISLEDIQTNDVPAIARTTLRLTRAVTKAVDLNMWECISESTHGSTPRTASTNTNVVTITAGEEWDSVTIANRDPIQNILDAKKEIYIDNYNPDSNGYLILNPTDYSNLMGNANVRNAGQFYTDDVTRNGKVGFLLGLQVIVSNTVPSDWAAVIVAKECANWKQLIPLTTKLIDDAGIGTTIRIWELGVGQLVNPECVCMITGTKV